MRQPAVTLGPLAIAPFADSFSQSGASGSGSANESGSGVRAVQWARASESGAGPGAGPASLGWQGMTLPPGLLLEGEPGFWLFILTLCRLVSEVFGIISNVRCAARLSFAFRSVRLSRRN